MFRSRSLYALGAGLVLSLAVAGCSGDKSSGSIVNVDPSINLSESAAKISQLESFRFTLNASIDVGNQAPATAEEALGGAMTAMLLSGLKDVSVEGALVAPDKLQVSLKMSGQEFGLVQLGDQAWANMGGAWMTIAPEDFGLEDGFDFGDFTADALPVEVVEAAKVTKEKVNGIDTTRYSFDKAALQSLADDAAADQNLETAELDVWLTEDGIPVKLTTKFSAKDETGQLMSGQLEFSLKDLNKKIDIKAPM